MVNVFNPKGEEGTKEEIYKRHAYPSDEQIVKKVGEVREEWETREPGGRKLGRLYIATNGTQEETARLKEALGKAGEWDMIASTYDLVLYMNNSTSRMPLTPRYQSGLACSSVRG